MCQSLALTKEGWNLLSQKYRSKEQPQNKHRTLYRSLSLSEQQTEQGVLTSASYTLKRSSDKIINGLPAPLYTHVEDQNNIS